MCKFCERIDSVTVPTVVGSQNYLDILKAMEDMALNASLASSLPRNVKYRLISHLTYDSGFQRKIRTVFNRRGELVEFVVTEKDEVPETY